MLTLTIARHVLGYTISIGVVSWFFCVSLKINSEWIPAYIPVWTNLGILLRFSFDHIWSISREKIGRIYYITTAIVELFRSNFDRDSNLERLNHGSGLSSRETEWPLEPQSSQHLGHSLADSQTGPEDCSGIV